MLKTIASILFVIFGLLSLLAAVFNFKWFFTSENGKSLVKMFGLRGARIFYGIAGILILYMAYHVYSMSVE